MNASGAPKSGFREIAAKLLPWVTAVWVLIELVSLRLPLLNRFFFDTLHADVQGIDYYSLPKAWLNLAAGRSMYATFDPPTYGPHFTWYLAHPLLAVVLGWPLSRLDPTDSYGAFTMLSLGFMAASSFVLARETEDLLRRRIIWLLLLGGFPTFAMFYVGNVQSITVLGLSLLFVGMLRVARQHSGAGPFVCAGLLVCLFSKPIVFLALPLLLLLRATRRSTGLALAVYVPLSLLCELIGAVNPEHVGLGRVFWLAVHPGFVRGTMNIYVNHLILTPDMRDNSIHWLNLVAQSGFRLRHIDVFSLPVFLDTLLGVHTPDSLYLLPAIAVLGLSVAVARVADHATRRECALLLTMAATLSFFLSYPTVWEYQYTAVLPVAAVLLMLRDSALLSGWRWTWSFGLAACAFLPSLYFLSGTAAPTPQVETLVRLDRVVPVTVLFLLLLWVVARATFSASRRRLSAAETRQDCSLQAESRA